MNSAQPKPPSVLDAIADRRPRSVKNPDELKEWAVKYQTSLSREEQRTVDHAQYQVDHASDEKPEVSFDFTLVQTWLDLTKRLARASRYYERELKRIRDATACSAGNIRNIADKALSK